MKRERRELAPELGARRDMGASPSSNGANANDVAKDVETLTIADDARAIEVGANARSRDGATGERASDAIARDDAKDLANANAKEDVLRGNENGEIKESKARASANGVLTNASEVEVEFRPFAAPLAFLAAAKILGVKTTCLEQTKTAPERATAKVDGGRGTIVGAGEMVDAIAVIAGEGESALAGTSDDDKASVLEWLAQSKKLLPGGGFEKQCEQVDEYLAARTYLVGHGLTLADLVMWAEFTTNRQWPVVVKKNKCINVQRWLAMLNSDETLRTVIAESEAGNPILSKKAPIAAPDAAGAKVKAAGTTGSFEVDLPGAEDGKVVTRFPPEPSGFLHIGHAKAALLNHYFARRYNGKLIVRFDDTNPDKENNDFVDSIMKDINTLDLKPDIVTYTSDSFGLIIDMGDKLISEGKMYIDSTDVDKMREERMARVESKCRNQSIEENMRLWKEMKAGSPEGIECAARFKIDMSHNNGCMRDPVAFRCNVNTPHHRTGTKYKVYPTYDCACPFVDAHEGVTHALRTSEYADREDQYIWIQKAMGLRKVHIWEYSRLNLEYTTLSKRKLQWFVDEGYSTGWDDPRFPTVQGVARRGLQIEALKEFMLSQGASKNCNLMEWTKIWSMNKKVIDPIAPRHVCVTDANRVVVKVIGFPEGEHWFTTPKNKKNPELGVKVTLRMAEILLDQVDAQAISEGEECTLMDWGNAFFKNIVKEGDVVKSMDCEINPDGDVKTTNLKLTWLANWNELVPVIMKDFDYLITKKKPEESDEFKDIVNKTTEVITLAHGDGNLRAYNKGTIVQIERKGFFIVDRVYVNPENPMILLNIPDGKKATWGVGAK